MRWAFSLYPKDEQARVKSSEQLVFLHGMGGTGKLWRPIAAGLEDDHRILAPDQRGHGESRPVTDGRGFSPEDYAADCLETMEATGFSPAWLIGHSMGVRTACATADLNPDAVRGLVLIDLGFSGIAGGGLGEKLSQFLSQLPDGFPSRADARTFMETRCPDPSMGQYLMAVGQPLADGRFVFPFDRMSLLATLEASRGSSVREGLLRYARLGKPVWVLRGAESGVWSRADFEKERAAFASLPNVTFQEMEGAGHGLPFEVRGRFIAELKDWLARVA